MSTPDVRPMPDHPAHDPAQDCEICETWVAQVVDDLQAERIATYPAAENLCRRCGEPLADTFHAHPPFTDGPEVA